MRVRYAADVDVEVLLDADAAPWASAPAETLSLMGTPVGLQPTAAIRASWTGKKIGAVERVEVAALHTGRNLAFRLEWADATENRDLTETTSFPDAAAVLLPSTPEATVMTMGAPGAAVNAWYWRADADACRHIVAEGLGTTRTVDVELVRGRGVWKGGRWRVVIVRALRIDTKEPVAQLEVGAETGFGVAVWDGANGERAGIKAFSGDWQELVLDATKLARR
jgi:complex iron-sulfur molybdoenzyme family reductase subunit gamma